MTPRRKKMSDQTRHPGAMIETGRGPTQHVHGLRDSFKNAVEGSGSAVETLETLIQSMGTIVQNLETEVDQLVRLYSSITGEANPEPTPPDDEEAGSLYQQAYQVRERLSTQYNRLLSIREGLVNRLVNML
jgi:hypothetical protein